MQERDVVAVASGGPYARVDAHVAHHSADDEFPYARPAEGVVEIRLEKSVRRVFDDDGSPSSGLTAPCILEPGVSGRKKAAPGRVLICRTWKTGLCCSRKRSSASRACAAASSAWDSSHAPAGEIVVLDVDQEKCRIHAVPPGVVPTIAACGGKYSSYFFVGMPSAAGMMPLCSKMSACPFSSMYSTPISCMIRTARNSFSPRSVRK